jgi:hypothetical protein
MQQQNIPIGTLVDMYKRGEMHLPENQHHCVWRATRAAYPADAVSKQVEVALQSQCVPVDPALWSVERYRDFLQPRRTELAARMNASLEEKAGK